MTVDFMCGFVFGDCLLGLSTNSLKKNQPGYFRVSPLGPVFVLSLVYQIWPRTAPSFCF